MRIKIILLITFMTIILLANSSICAHDIVLPSKNATIGYSTTHNWKQTNLERYLKYVFNYDTINNENLDIIGYFLDCYQNNGLYKIEKQLYAYTQDKYEGCPVDKGLMIKFDLKDNDSLKNIEIFDNYTASVHQDVSKIKEKCENISKNVSHEFDVFNYNDSNFKLDWVKLPEQKPGGDPYVNGNTEIAEDNVDNNEPYNANGIPSAASPDIPGMDGLDIPGMGGLGDLLNGDFISKIIDMIKPYLPIVILALVLIQVAAIFVAEGIKKLMYGLYRLIIKTNVKGRNLIFKRKKKDEDIVNDKEINNEKDG